MRRYVLLSVSLAVAVAVPILGDQPDFKDLIEITRPSQPGFRERVVSLLGSRDAAALTPLLTRSLVITNNSGRVIQSFTLTETKRAKDGSLAYSVVRNGRGAQANPKSQTLAAGASRVVTTEPAVSWLLVKTERSEADSERLGQLSQALPNANNMAEMTLLSVDLDSVVLDDGRVLGPDRYGVVEEYADEVRALDAEIQIAEKLAREGGVEDAVARLDAVTKKEIPSLDLENPGPERRGMVEIRTSLLLRDLLKSRSPADTADYLSRYVRRLKRIELHR